MTTRLHLSDDLSMPTDAVTRTFGVLAVRGAGKSSTARVMAEEMHKAGLPFVVVDPDGGWWGLRSSKSGKGKGIAIPILGGKHGDIPLERGGGRLVADLVVDTRLSCILDLDLFESESARKEFLLDFAIQLYKRNTEPLHLFLEEADDYIPQKPMREEVRLLRAWENIVRRGRKRGLGMTMISQRSAVINKNVLTQVENLIVMRTTAPQDRKAIQAWVDYKGQSRELMESLPELEDGEAWVWSPHWLKKNVRIQVRPVETFDSGATPKARRSRRVATLADVDLNAFQKRMADTIRRAKASDPKELRRRVAELEAKLVQAQAKVEVKVVKAAYSKVVVKPILRDRDIQRLEAAANTISSALYGYLAKTEAIPAPTIVMPKPRALPSLVPVDGKPALSLRAGEGRILVAIGQHPSGCTREQITVLTGYKRSSRDTYLNRLRIAGMIEGTDRILLTEKGIRSLPDLDPLPTGEALASYWLDKLPRGESSVLAVVLKAYPQPVDREVITQVTGYKRSSRDTYLQRLRARELVALEGRAGVYASHSLFE